MNKQKPSTTEKIYNEIRDCIVQRKYYPGAHLVEADLMKTFGCSRSTLRESLRRLSSDGLVEHIPNKGILVRRLSLKEFLDILYILQMLETLSTRLAAESCNGQNMNEIKKIIANYERYLDAQNTTEASKWAVRFKQYIAEITCNEYLIKSIDQYYTMLVTNAGQANNWNQFKYEMARNGIEYYKALLQAIEQGNAKLAAELTYNEMQFEIDTVKNFPTQFFI